MNTASYTSTQTATGGAGKYPLSTETLDFIQEQIMLLEALAGIGGTNYILRAPDGANEGAAVIVNGDGVAELLRIQPKPVYSTSVKYLTVTTKVENVKADAETYLEARTLRTAQFTAAKGAESYELDKFANISSKTLSAFPTNAALYEQLKNLPTTILTYIKDPLAEKLTAKAVSGLTQAQMDTLKTACVLSCSASVSLFGSTGYTLIVTEQGTGTVRQELIQGQDVRYVRTYSGGVWGAWVQQLETAMHLDVKIVGSTVYLRHGALPSDCDIVLLRKKKRSAWRATGGPNSYTKNRGKSKKRQPKRQYVHFKGIRLSKGEPGKWYVPKCISVADKAKDGNLIGKELPSLCASLFYVGADGLYHVQGVRKKLILKTTTNRKGTAHRAYAPIGVQIARLGSTGGKDSGGEIVRMKYRVNQQCTRSATTGKYSYNWIRKFSQD